MIRVVVGDPASIPCDAVVRPATETLEATPNAYPELERAAASGFRILTAPNLLEPGAAVVTGAADLQAEFIIHAVVRQGSAPPNATDLRRALESALHQAHEWGLDVVAVPPLDLDAEGHVTKATARVMTSTLIAHLGENRHPSEVVLVAPTDRDRTVFAHYLPEVPE